MPMIPGTQTIAVYEMIEIRAIVGQEVSIAITVAPTDTEIPVGTVMGKVTANKLYYPYDNTKTDGRETAKVVLGEAVPASTEEQVVTGYVKGIFYSDKLQGLDAGAMVDLFAREIDGIVVI